MALKLEYAVPKAAILEKFPNAREQVKATTISEFLKHCPDDVAGPCMYIWDVMVSKQMVSNLYAIAPVIQNDYQGIYEFIKSELKKHPWSDAYEVEFFNEYSEESFAEISLVQCFPNDIHICDVEFSDNTQPIPIIDIQSKFRDFKSLHLFGPFLERLKEIGRERKVDRISLLVAYPSLYPVFKKHGFKPRLLTPFSHAGFKAGSGFPMVLDLNS